MQTTSVAAALAASAAAPAQEAKFVSTSDVSIAFLENCSDLTAEDKPRLALAANDWSVTSIAENEGLLAFTSLHAHRKGHRLEAEAYGNSHYPDIFVVVSKTFAHDAYVLDCHAVTFAATADFTEADVERLTAGRPASERIDNANAHSARWTPGLFPGHAETFISFLPTKSKFRTVLPSPSPYMMLLGRSPTRPVGEVMTTKERAE